MKSEVKKTIDLSCSCDYSELMAKKGRPPKEEGKKGLLDIRVDVDEKQAFKDAADLAGLGLSAWVRERLRTIARKELEAAGKKVAFLK